VQNKIALKEKLVFNSGAFLVGMVTGIAEQKVIDLVLQTLDQLPENIQMLNLCC